MQNSILRTNLTTLAIVLQTSFLKSTAHDIYMIRSAPQDGYFLGLVIFCLLPLLLCSIWMVSNLRYEQDKVQRRKNAMIELGYCCIQALLGLITIFGIGLVGTVLMLIVGIAYILYINPKYMKRKLTR